MKIVFYSDNLYPEISGISDSILILGNELIKRGHMVAYVGPKYSKNNYQITNSASDNNINSRFYNIPVFRLPSFFFPGSPTGQSRIALPFGFSKKFIKDFSPDIIHTQSPFGAGREAYYVSKKFNIPIIGTNHTPPEEFLPKLLNRSKIAIRLFKKFYSNYYNHCLYISTPSNELLFSMKENGLNVSSKSIPNPILLNSFNPISLDKKNIIKKELNISGPIVMYAGRLAYEKHVDILIRAIKILSTTFPDIKLIITGHGSAADSLKKLAIDLNIENNIIFTGYIDMAELVKMYSISDVFSIMSTAETQSLALMQAFASGVPAVCANSHGLVEYVKSDCGFLINYNDFEKLAELIKKIILDYNLKSKMSEECVKYVAQFSPESICNIWENIYKEIISSKNNIMKISVVIPAHNEEKEIARTIEAVLAQNYSDFEIIVVNNASTDRTFEIASKYPIKVVTEMRKGLLWARERGRQEAVGEIIANIDSDCLPEKDWLSKGFLNFKNTEIIAVTGPYDYYDGGIFFRNSSLFFQKNIYLLINKILQLSFIKSGAVLIGGNNFIRSDILKKTNGYNTNLKFYGEDTDTAKRVSKYGRVIFDRKLKMKTSARRFKSEGKIRLTLRYFFYFFKIIFS